MGRPDIQYSNQEEHRCFRSSPRKYACGVVASQMQRKSGLYGLGKGDTEP